HADGRCASRHVANQHRGRRTGNAGHAVMFGHPVTLIAPALGMLGDIQGVPKGFRSVASFGNGRQVENGKRYLGHYLQVGAEPDKTSRNFYGIVSLFGALAQPVRRSEEHTSELQSRENLVCRLLLEKKKIEFDGCILPFNLATLEVT